jgi:hypothetical protein
MFTLCVVVPHQQAMAIFSPSKPIKKTTLLNFQVAWMNK